MVIKLDFSIWYWTAIKINAGYNWLFCYFPLYYWDNDLLGYENIKTAVSFGIYTFTVACKITRHRISSKENFYFPEYFSQRLNCCKIWISFCVKRNHEEIKSASYTFRFSFISILLKRVAVPTFHVSTRVPKKYILINCLRWFNWSNFLFSLQHQISKFPTNETDFSKLKFCRFVMGLQINGIFRDSLRFRC